MRVAQIGGFVKETPESLLTVAAAPVHCCSCPDGFMDVRTCEYACGSILNLISFASKMIGASSDLLIVCNGLKLLERLSCLS